MPKVAPQIAGFCLSRLEDGSVEDIAVSSGPPSHALQPIVRMHHHQERPIEAGHGITNGNRIRQHGRPEAPAASRESDPDLGAGPASGILQGQGYDEASVSMQPGESADRLRLATIDSKRLVAAFREEPRV